MLPGGGVVAGPDGAMPLRAGCLRLPPGGFDVLSARAFELDDAVFKALNRDGFTFVNHQLISTWWLAVGSQIPFGVPRRLVKQGSIA